MNAGRRLVGQVERLKSRLKNRSEEMKQNEEQLLTTATTTGTAFAIGYVDGRYQERAEVFGIPASVLVGLAGHVAGFAGFGPSTVMHSVGDGGLAAYAVTLGAGLGQKARLESDAGGTPPGPPPTP